MIFGEFEIRQNHISGYIKQRLDYFFISNKLQESIKNTDILASLSTDHSPISFTLRRSQKNRYRQRFVDL